MALIASDIKLADPLKDPLSGIGKKTQGNLESMLGRVRQRNRAGQLASGRPVGEYTAPTLDFAGSMAGRGIDDALYGALGGASYQDYKNEQENLRKISLAKRIGKAMKPSVGQQILGGIGMAGQVAPALIGAGKSAYNYFNPGGTGAIAFGSGANPFDVESALGRIRGYDDYAGMLRR